MEDFNQPERNELLQYALKAKFDPLKVNPYVRFLSRYNVDSKEHHVPWRMLYDYSLICVLSGELWFIYGKEEVCVQAGEAHLMPPGVNHKEKIKKGERCKYYVVHFDFFYDENRTDIDMEQVYLSQCVAGVYAVKPDKALLESAKNESDFLKKPLKIRPREFDEVVMRLKRMEAVLERNRFRTAQLADSLILKGNMLEILAFLLKDEEEKTVEHYPCVDRFLSHVRHHFAEEIDISALSSDYGFTPNYFREIFKKITGITPFEYLQRIRIFRAQKLLREGAMSVQEVAFAVGFQDPFYFSKVFKKRTGFTPSQFAAKNDSDEYLIRQESDFEYYRKSFDL